MTSPEPSPSTPDPGPAAAPRRSAVEHIANVVGDLDSPFYDEERDRDVWNEASAVGFQTMLWGLPIVSAVLLWTRSGDAALPVVAMLVPWIVAMLLTLAHARRHAVDPGHAEALAASRVRMALFAVVIAALATGFLRVGLDLEVSGTLGSFLRGAAQGASAAFLGVAAWAMYVAIREGRRRAAPGSQSAP